MRAAAEKYYELEPASFSSIAGVEGSWTLGNESALSGVVNSEDFGWGFLQGLSLVDVADANGLAAFHYVDPSGWFRGFPEYEGGPQPPYGVLVGALFTDAATGTRLTVDGTPIKEMAQATINSSPHDPTGLFQVHAKSHFWYANRLQIYPVSPDPDIPAPSMWSAIKKYRVDPRIGSHIDGIFLDDISATFGNVKNHRRPSGPTATCRCRFRTRRVRSCSTTDSRSESSVRDCAAISTATGWSRPPASCRARTSGSPHRRTCSAGGDGRGADGQGLRAADARVRQTMEQPSREPDELAAADGPTVLKYLRQALPLGYFPGAAGEYWGAPLAYERDRALWRTYIPLIRRIAQAGWKPIPTRRAPSRESYWSGSTGDPNRRST